MYMVSAPVFFPTCGLLKSIFSRSILSKHNLSPYISHCNIKAVFASNTKYLVQHPQYQIFSSTPTIPNI